MLLATNADNPVMAYNGVGILGAGFTALSSLADLARENGMSGNSLLPNLFQNNAVAPIMTLSFQSSLDSSSSVTGSLGIGDYSLSILKITLNPRYRSN